MDNDSHKRVRGRLQPLLGLTVCLYQLFRHWGHCLQSHTCKLLLRLFSSPNYTSSWNMLENKTNLQTILYFFLICGKKKKKVKIWLLKKYFYFFFFKVYWCFIPWVCMGFAVTLQTLHLPGFHILKTTGWLINTASCPNAQTTVPVSALIDVYPSCFKSPPGMVIPYYHQWYWWTTLIHLFF